jgi:hypothetical protein
MSPHSAWEALAKQMNTKTDEYQHKMATDGHGISFHLGDI